MKRWTVGICVLLLLAVDMLTKWATVQYIPLIHTGPYLYPYQGIGVFQNFLGIEFSLCHTSNTGAAWGMFGDWQMYLLALRVCLIFAIAAYVALYVTDRRMQFPFALILTGAIGNVIDYFVYGHVIDMLHFVLWGYDFPVFNVADSLITLGVAGLMAITLVYGDQKSSKVHDVS
ncbi:MAG: signal peptidase II [Chlamydiia bacterium]|nr:signal peptidase II [Chlamydiia bacterium]